MSIEEPFIRQSRDENDQPAAAFILRPDTTFQHFGDCSAAVDLIAATIAPAPAQPSVE